MKKLVFSLVLLGLPFSVTPQTVRLSDEAPSWGTKLTIYYQPDTTTQFQVGDGIFLRWTSIAQDHDRQSDLVKMKPAGDEFIAQLEVKEGVAAYSLQFQSGSKYDYAAMKTVKCRDENGGFYRNAYQLELMQNPDLYKTELETYPDNFSVYQTRWQLLGYTAQDSVEQIIRRELKKIKAQDARNDAYYFAQAVGSTQLGEWEEARTAMRELMNRYPQSPLIERGYSWFQYQSFSQSAPDSLLEESVRAFIQKYPQSPIARKQLRLLCKEEGVLNRQALEKAALYWITQDDSDPLLYYYLSRAKAESLESDELLKIATDKLVDPFLGMKHQHAWSIDIPYYLMEFIKEYEKNGNATAAWGLIQLIEENTRKLSPKHFVKKGQILTTMGNYEQAVETFLIASDQGDEEAMTMAKELFTQHMAEQTDDFDAFASNLLRRLFYEEEVAAAMPFSATDLAGNTYTLQDLEGKVVVLNFWFIGCAPCRVEIPGLNEMVSEYDPKEVVFIAFALDDEEALAAFLAEAPFHYQIVASAQKVVSDYQVNSYPTHIIIDKRGNVRSTLVGGAKDRHRQIKPLIDRLLRY